MNRGRLTAIGALVVAMLAGARQARAWDNFGHMLVAAAAYDKLKPAVKDEVDRLLQINPQYATWVEGVAAADARKVAFMMAARWPDWIKSAPGYTADGSDKGNRPPADATASQNIGYGDKAMHKYWHFVDKPYKADKTPTKPPPSVNAKTEMALLLKALKSKTTSDDVRSYDLVWLEHLTGDVHQPLHCVSRFDKDDPDGDAGGNNVKITGAGETNLHALWDDFPGTSDVPGDALAAQSGLPAPDAAKAKIATQATWIDESFAAAKKFAYAPPIALGDGPFVVTEAYESSGRSVSQARIALAAARLANLLNTALKK